MFLLPRAPRQSLFLPVSVVAIAILSALGVRPAAAADQGIRTWKDSSGSFEIKAFLVGEENGMVTLKQEDGEQLEIELDKLSTLDQNFIKSQKSKMSPFKKKGAASPFKAKGTKPMPSGGSDSSSGSASAAGSSVSVDWTGAALVQTADSSDWSKIQIEAAASSGKKKAVALPKKRDFFEKMTGFVAGPQFAAVGYKLERPGKKDEVSTRISVADLNAGKSAGSAIVDGSFALLDMAPDGKSFLVKKDEWGFGNQADVEVWTLSGSSVNRVMSTTPFLDDNGKPQNVTWGGFVDDDHVVVLCDSGKFGMFSTQTGAAEYQGMLNNQAAIVLSPDRKYLAAATGKDIQIMDAKTGEGLATLATEPQTFPGMAFSSDGKRFCLQASEKLTAWNLADGSIYREIVLSGLPLQATIPPVWAGDSHVLAGGSVLVDLENYVRLWQVSGAEGATNVGEQTLFCIGGDTSGLVPVKLPTDGMAKTLKQAMTDPSFFVVSPGTAVKIDVTGVGDPSQQQKARDGLTQKLNAVGLKPSDNAAVVLKASIENKGNEDMNFRSFGGGFATKTVSVTKYLSKVVLLVNNQPAWETSMMATPHFVNRSEDESIEQAVRKANQPNYFFFEAVGIPGYVMKPLGRPTLGMSQITTSGLK